MIFVIIEGVNSNPMSTCVDVSVIVNKHFDFFSCFQL